MAIHPKGYDLSLDRIKRLLSNLGDPQDRVPPIIHFAGTNGKGSTIAFTRSLLEAAGLSVHVHTSPHLVSWHERYRLGRPGGGQLVDDVTLSDAIRRVADANGGQPITVFEVLTAVSFLLFSEHEADVCLIEVGLGGRFDCTNVMQKTDICAITPVSFDHEAYLGDTLAKIAFEKAGIIKQRTDVVVGPQQDEALVVIERQAGKNLAPIHRASQEYSTSIENGRMIYQGEDVLFDLELPRLPGMHQIDNAATAITITRIFCNKHKHELTNDMVNSGVQNANWPGRMQKLIEGKLVDSAPKGSAIWLDGGHNPDAGNVVSAFIKSHLTPTERPVIMICGMLDTKDASSYLSKFSGLINRIITVPIISSDAGIPPRNLADTAVKAGFEAGTAASIPEALADLDPAVPVSVLIAGSLYLVGDALEKNGIPLE